MSYSPYDDPRYQYYGQQEQGQGQNEQQQQYEQQQQQYEQYQNQQYYDEGGNEYYYGGGDLGVVADAGGDGAGGLYYDEGAYIPDPNASSFVPSMTVTTAVGTEMYQQQQPQQESVYDYSDQQQLQQQQQLYPSNMMMEDPDAMMYADNSDNPYVAVSTSPGQYYLDGELLPQIYDHAVSAVAYDRSYRCLYISSTTQSSTTQGIGGGGGRFASQWSRGGAASVPSSLLMSYSTQSRRNIVVEDGRQGLFMDGGMMYSSVAGHPQASSSTLECIYEAIYGVSKVVLPSPSVALLMATAGVGAGLTNIPGQPPSHAYRPPYGSGSNNDNINAAVYPHQQQHHQNNRYQQRGHMGINDLLPLDGTDGYVASVSPSSVRVHSYGGLQVSHNDIEGMICGTIHPHPGIAAATHITVGGLHVDPPSSSSSSTTPKPTPAHKGQSIHCMDLWQGLRTVQSISFNNVDARTVAVTAMATSHEKGSIVAGCSDGMIRLLSPSLQELATIKSNIGGVSSVAISPDGMLIATTGYSSKARPTTSNTTATAGGDARNTATALYAFPDTTVYVYDIRYLGRGGIAHPFTGVKGAPRHLTFIPDMDGFVSNRLLVSSGKSGGGVQIMTPFEIQSESVTSFFVPPLENDEFVTALSVPDYDELAFGTSIGRVLTYRLQGYENQKPRVDMNGQLIEKTELLVPPYIPPPPAVSLTPDLLQGDPALRNGANDQQRNLFSTYLLYSDPTLTPIGETPDEAAPSFGSLAVTPIVEDVRRTIKNTLMSKAVIGERDYVSTIPISASGLDIDVFANHNAVSKRYKGKKSQTTLNNPNKFLHCPKLTSMVYEDGWYTKRKEQQNHQSNQGSSHGIPSRYQITSRPNFRSSGGSFDVSESNDTGLLPGWDYSPSLPNAWACPVLLLFYFVPEVRQAALSSQFIDKYSVSSVQKSYDRALTPELGFVFHQIESLSRFGLLYPSKSQKALLRPRIGTWTPTNFLSFLATMVEAEQLQVLDSSPSAVDLPRRPESFYRFLAYQMDKELDILAGSSRASISKLMDSLNGLDFVSSNQFIESTTNPPTHSSTRALTLDLNYDVFPSGSKKTAIRFGKLLQHSLCRETRLRAWNNTSKAYETIVQRKIATSLPPVLTLSCSCAGRKEEDGLWAWRSENGEDPWLPEFVEIELKEGGSVVVTEWSNGNGDSFVFKSKSALPDEVSKLVAASSSPQKQLYRLEAVVSYISNPEHDDSIDEEGASGHHVLHARVSVAEKKRIFKSQSKEARKVSSMQSATQDEEYASNFVVSASARAKELDERAAQIDQQAVACEKTEKQEVNRYPPVVHSQWVLYNGSSVSKTVVEDARAFHVTFKEPVLVMFRAIDKDGNTGGEPHEDLKETDNKKKLETSKLSSMVKNIPVLSTSANKTRLKSALGDLTAGSPVAFDAEFVSVQEEDSTLNESGQKVVVSDTRHAVGRVSVLECHSKNVIVDDHVLPRERVVDYLTRFSGITPDDLDPRRTKHRLISTRSAYLELRYILEQGCVFVGHGLKQDFSTVNLVVPPNQILDTVELFRVPGMRYVSLRFLTNFVLHRDMQQDIHDSVEDARAAYELFETARQWKKEGVWDQKLRELYAYGEKTGWKLGVDEVPP
jgi:PAB-dependent poly(A)-specific ribonuclease subunit 2